MKIFYENWHDRIHVAKRKGFAFANHMHDMVEIVYLTKGTVDVNCNGACYRLRPGELFIVFPNLMHAYSHTEAVAGYFAIFEINILKKLWGKLFLPDTCASIVSAEALSPKIPLLFEEAIETFVN